jgi:hypothetical protein
LRWRLTWSVEWIRWLTPAGMNPAHARRCIVKGAVVFARSQRPTRVLLLLALAASLALFAATAWELLAWRGWDALAVSLLAIVAGAFTIRFYLRLRRGPLSRLGVFSDRLVLIGGRLELQADWADVTSASLADRSDWGSASWPELRLTDRLSIQRANGPSFSFHPRAYGLEPEVCRDLFLKLRDDAQARARLPEFDSLKDLAVRNADAWDRSRPQL